MESVRDLSVHICEQCCCHMMHVPPGGNGWHTFSIPCVYLFIVDRPWPYLGALGVLDSKVHGSHF
jgi:hypothetical protein